MSSPAPHVIQKRIRSLILVQHRYVNLLVNNMSLMPPAPDPAAFVSKRQWEIQMQSYRAALRALALHSAAVDDMVI